MEQLWVVVEFLVTGELLRRQADEVLFVIAAHKERTRMELCLDNDPPGRTATAALAEHYGKQYALTIRLPQPDGADYGDLAQMAMRQKALKRERAEIAR